MESSRFARPLVDTVVYAELLLDSNRTAFTKRTGREIVDYFNQSKVREKSDLYGPVVFSDISLSPFEFGQPDIFEGKCLFFSLLS